MRLLLLSSEFPPGPGGIGTHACELAQHLSQMGWEVLVVTSQNYSSKDEIESFNRSRQFKIVSLAHLPGAPLKALYRWCVISGWVKRWKPDVLLASGDRDVYLGAQLARRYRLPWMAVEHGRIPPKWERRLKCWSFQQASAVVCVSEYTWQRMLMLGIQPRGGRVIPNGADAVRFKELPTQVTADFRGGLGFGSERILLTVGSVTDRKGQDVVIRALPRILEKFGDTHYLAAGLPIKQKQFAKLAHELGIADHVHFLGQVETRTLLCLLNCCDVFVMTSRHTADEFEGFGIAVVEAALCGKPAVVSANSGLAESIVDGETGFGVPENDETATAQKIISLLEDEEQRRKMGKAAQRHALEQHTWGHSATEYDTLLRTLLQLPATVPDEKNVSKNRLIHVSH
jgi:phosphatidylinositol alpha-1,6-mannosyltransferase